MVPNSNNVETTVEFTETDFKALQKCWATTNNWHCFSDTQQHSTVHITLIFVSSSSIYLPLENTLYIYTIDIITLTAYPWLLDCVCVTLLSLWILSIFLLHQFCYLLQMRAFLLLYLCVRVNTYSSLQHCDQACTYHRPIPDIPLSALPTSTPMPGGMFGLCICKYTKIPPVPYRVHEYMSGGSDG